MVEEKKKIGLVTLYDENYGSILQCFSTKHFLESLNLTCDVLCLVQDECLLRLEVLKRKLKTLLKIFCNLPFFKFIVKSKLHIIKSSLSKETEKMMNSFVADFIKPKEIEQSLLNEKKWLDEYKCFVAGSDQIWNVGHLVKPFDFLQFAPPFKRRTLAVSFGISEIPLCNQSELSAGLNGFDYVSVREETGMEIVKKYSGAKVCRLADPTLIYCADEWRSLAGNAAVPKQKYVLLHFLNAPNDVALNAIKWISEGLNLSVIAVGYKHPVFKQLEKFTFMDGGPWEYISLIDNADYILTDSFHSSLFSINLGKRFFVFHRNYSVLSQNSRINDMLGRFKMQNRLIFDIDFLKNIYLDELPKDSVNILERERKVIRDYIRKSILEDDISFLRGQE